MLQNHKKRIKDLFERSFKEEIQNLLTIDLDSLKYQSLSDELVNELAERISALPYEYRNILYSRYCFENTPSVTEKMLGIESAIGKARYAQKLLSIALGLTDSWIDDLSMKKASRIALEEEIRDFDSIEINYKPNYSKKFRKKLKEIKVSSNSNKLYLVIAKRVAILILICGLSFSTVLAVNAEIREKVVDWIIETFPQFTIFISEYEDTDNKPVELTSIQVNYIPEGFLLEETNIGKKMLVYNYSNSNEQRITILLSYGESRSYLDTEDAVIEEIDFKGSQAYIWQADEITYMIWHQNGVKCQVSGNVDKREIIKIAENISLK
jgi:hypothetical protein